MHSANGVVVRNIETDRNEIELNVSDLQKGIYFIKLNISGSTVVRRVVIL
nr:T9SS type A sorting domain-containing protein [Bacteroidota bacterium]